MPRIESSLVVPVPAETAFAVSMTTGEIRYRWDPFVRRQELLDGADKPGKGVRTETRSWHGLKMVSEYTSFRPPTQVGMKMVDGPWFFGTLGGGWSFAPVDEESCTATWRYTFTIKPKLLRPIAEPIGRWLLGRDIRKRIGGFAKGCEDPIVVAAATAG